MKTPSQSLPESMYTPASTGAFARSVETLERYAKHIGFIRAKSQLASIAGNSLAAWHVRAAAETVLRDIQSKSIHDIFDCHGINCAQIPNNSHRNAIETLSALYRA